MEVVLSGEVYAFILVFARVASIVMLLPGLANPGPPARIRLAFALLLTWAMLPTVAGAAPAQPDNALGGVTLIVVEVVLGLAIGMLVRLLMMALSVAGQVIAMQTGLAMAMNFDPAQNQQGAVFGTFFSVVAVTLIFTTGLHHGFMRGIAGSYGVLPPGLAFPTGDFAMLALDMATQGISVAMQMAAPLIVFGLVFYAGMGVLSKLMPQANIFFVGMPLNVMLGLVIFCLTLGAALLVWLDHAERFVDRLV